MKKLKVGEPYNIIFSNKHLATKYLHKEIKEGSTLDDSKKNEVKKNNNNTFSKTTFKKRLKTMFIFAGSCFVLASYFSLMIIGGIVCILMF